MLREEAEDPGDDAAPPRDRVGRVGEADERSEPEAHVPHALLLEALEGGHVHELGDARGRVGRPPREVEHDALEPSPGGDEGREAEDLLAAQRDERPAERSVLASELADHEVEELLRAALPREPGGRDLLELSLDGLASRAIDAELRHGDALALRPLHLVPELHEARALRLEELEVERERRPELVEPEARVPVERHVLGPELEGADPFPLDAREGAEGLEEPRLVVGRGEDGPELEEPASAWPVGDEPFEVGRREVARLAVEGEERGGVAREALEERDGGDG